MENIGPSLASTFQSHIERLVSSPEESQQRAAAEVTFLTSSLLFTSVGNLWHFGVDPDPRIRTSD